MEAQKDFEIAAVPEGPYVIPLFDNVLTT